MRRSNVKGWNNPIYNNLATKSSRRWTVLPGNWDRVNSQYIFHSTNRWGIPDLIETTFVPKTLLYYGRWKSFEDAPRGSAVHFWMDDYRFEGLWNKPVLNLDKLIAVGGVITPDFSIFSDWPDALNMWQVYRNRWLGRFWQDQGIKVIPSISWNTPESMEYCFLGIPKGSVVGVETHTIRQEEERNVWREGFKVMLETLEPSLVISYGSIKRIGGYIPDCNLKEYSTFWEERNVAIHKKKELQAQQEQTE